MVRTIGVVLAGGRSSRMGEDKARVAVGARTMLEHVVAAVSHVTDSVSVAGRTEAMSGTRALPDPGDTHRGPLAGLAAAAQAHPDSTLVVVAVDQPWVRAATLRGLLQIGGPLPVVPVDGGVRQTTCAIYPTAALSHVMDELTGGGSIQSLLDRTSFRPVIEDEWMAWGEDGRSWYSADTASDLDIGIERFGPP